MLCSVDSSDVAAGGGNDRYFSDGGRCGMRAGQVLAPAETVLSCMRTAAGRGCDLVLVDACVESAVAALATHFATILFSIILAHLATAFRLPDDDATEGSSTT